MKEELSVCHISTVHPLNNNRVYLKEILSLANAGYRVDFIVKKDEVKFPHPNVKFHFLPNKKGALNRVINNFRALFTAIHLNRDVYHFHDPELIFTGLILKIFFRKHVIYDIHELYRDALLRKSYLPGVLGKIVSNIYVMIENVATNIFDYIILAERGYIPFYDGKRYSLVQNFIPQKYILNEFPENKFRDKLEFLYIGYIQKVRGIEEMIEFAAQMREEIDFTMHIIGPFIPSTSENDVKNLIRHKRVEKQIKLYGEIPFPQAVKIIQKSHFGLLFLHNTLNAATALPTKIFEYMGNGLVVLMSDVKAWVEFNNKYKCGFVLDVFNVQNEKKNILKILEDHQKLIEIGRNNIKLVRRHFTWEIEEKKLLAIYENLLNSTRNSK